MPCQKSMFIAKSGVARVDIVIPLSPTANETTAANDLKSYLTQISGATFKIKSDIAVDYPANIISVGDTSIVSSAMRTQLQIGTPLKITDRKGKGFLMKLYNRVLYLVGHDDQATIYAVNEFLRSLGCRWYAAIPDQAGIHIPSSPSIKCRQTDKEYYEPTFIYSKPYDWSAYINNAIVDDGTNEGYQVDYLVTTNNQLEGNVKETEYLSRNNAPTGSGAGISGDSGHNSDAIWSLSNSSSHWRGWQYVNNVLTQVTNSSTVGSQACYTYAGDPENGILSSRDQAVKWCREQLDKDENKDNQIVAITPVDYWGHCRCANCTALGNPSDQVLYMARYVGAALAESHPTKMLLVWAYSTSTKRFTDLTEPLKTAPDNVIIKITPVYDVDGQGCDGLITSFKERYTHLYLSPWFNYTPNPAGPAKYPLYAYEGNQYCYLDHVMRNLPLWDEWGVKFISFMSYRNYHNILFSRYVYLRAAWDANIDIPAEQWEFANNMFPTCPISFYNYISLITEFFCQPYYEGKGDSNVREFLKQAFTIFAYMKTQALTDDELYVWRWHVIYLCEQVRAYKVRRETNAVARIAYVKDLYKFHKRQAQYFHWDPVIQIGFDWTRLTAVVPEGTPTWTANYNYALNNTVWDGTHQYCYYKCTSDHGSSGSSPPPWNTTIGAITPDGGLVWTTQACHGMAQTQYIDPDLYDLPSGTGTWQANYNYASGAKVWDGVHPAFYFQVTTDNGTSGPGPNPPVWNTDINDTTIDGDLIWTTKASTKMEIQKYTPAEYTPDGVNYRWADLAADTWEMSDIDDIFADDKLNYVDALESPTSVNIIQVEVATELIRDGWTNVPPTGIAIAPTNFTSPTDRIDPNVNWI